MFIVHLFLIYLQLALENPSKYIKPKLISQAPKFLGREKAFAIQLFCISEVYEKR